MRRWVETEAGNRNGNGANYFLEPPAPKILSVTPNFRLFSVALRKFRCGARKFRCGAKKI